jgi:archaemetzincin
MKYLYLSATPEVLDGDDGGAIATVRDRLTLEFAVPVRELALPALDFAFDAARGQYASIPVLEMLVRRCPADAAKLVALTARDLFIPVLTFVYGHAQLGGRVAVVSLARLRQEFYGMPADRELFLERAAREALHEAGHTYGLRHCADGNCAMSLAVNIRQIDSRRGGFCASCTASLRRAQKSAAAQP